MNKDERKRRLRAWRESERATARAALPLPDAELKALFDVLDVSLPSHGCDHTLRLTREWAAARGHEVEPLVTWLNDNGGFCDCEALANAEQAWREAIRGR
jgi:hypothetical protein